jgi:hypothetical protein
MTGPMRAEADYPHVRSSNVCPLCRGYKETGLVACWSCYRAHSLRYGNEEAETLIEQAEIRLKRLHSSARPN